MMALKDNKQDVNSDLSLTGFKCGLYILFYTFVFCDF